MPADAASLPSSKLCRPVCTFSSTTPDASGSINGGKGKGRPAVAVAEEAAPWPMCASWAMLSKGRIAVRKAAPAPRDSRRRRVIPVMVILQTIISWPPKVWRRFSDQAGSSMGGRKSLFGILPLSAATSGGKPKSRTGVKARKFVPS